MSGNIGNAVALQCQEPSALSEKVQSQTSLSPPLSSSATFTDIDAFPETPSLLHQQRRWRFIAIFLGLMLSFFLECLDQTIVACALSRISSDFDAFTMSNWVPSAYMLTITAFQPIYGKISDIFGRTLVLLIAIAVFMIGSLLCGTARSMTWLIVARAVAGVGGAGIVALSSVIISDLVPLERRANYFSLLSVVMTISYVVGPVIGGLITDRLTWRWAFFINVPAGVIAMVVIGLLLRLPKPPGSWKDRLRRIDILGTCLFLAAMVPLLLALNWGGNEFSWRSPVIIALLCVAAIMTATFFAVEMWVSPEPVVPIQAFKRRNTVILLFAHFTAGIPMFTFVYYIPMYFMIGRNASATVSGVYLMPILVGLSVVSLIVSWSVTKFGLHRPLIVCAMAGLIVGSGLVVLLDQNSSIGKCIGILLIPGISLGFMFPIVTMGVQVTAKKEHLTVITTLVPFAITLAAAIGVSAMGTLLTNSFHRNVDSLVRDNPQYSETISRVLNNPSLIWNADITTDVRKSIIDAFIKSLHLLFYVNVVVVGLGFLATLGLNKFNPLNKPQETLSSTQ